MAIANSCSVLLALDEQSPDIAQGVNTAQESREHDSEEAFDSIGAGDQGRCLASPVTKRRN